MLLDATAHFDYELLFKRDILLKSKERSIHDQALHMNLFLKNLLLLKSTSGFSSSFKTWITNITEERSSMRKGDNVIDCHRSIITR
jgi:hypothetical protein